MDLDKVAVDLAMAKHLLEVAREVCKQPFQNVESLYSVVEESIYLIKKLLHNEVIAYEINAIKAAKVRGSQGLMAHSGH